MKLTYFRGDVPNFGDELNSYMWQRLLPKGFLTNDESRLFLGIGSILWDDLPKTPHKFIVGSGYGGYTNPPDVHDGSWTTVFVRGPRTAAALGISPSFALCDSAVLLRAIPRPAPRERSGIGFMPHFQSLGRGYWQQACTRAGIKFIDPTAPVETVLHQLEGISLLITEAMHGAIVADALRVPWIAAKPIHPEHHAKWLDWSEALGIDIRWHAILPTSMLELYIRATKGRRYYIGMATEVGRHKLMGPANRILVELAAARLTALAKAEPQLSADGVICDVTARAAEAVDDFVRREYWG